MKKKIGYHYPVKEYIGLLLQWHFACLYMCLEVMREHPCSLRLPHCNAYSLIQKT